MAREARKRGARLVITPHGQLEPWVVDEQYWKEKLPKQLLYQRRLISQAYAVVVQGRMEQECLERLGWNGRVTIIRNCLFTNFISPQKMATETYHVYRRVMDSNPLALMTDGTRGLIRSILKAGITGDRRWLHDTAAASPETPEQWRLLLNYIHQEQVEEVALRGMKLLNFNIPDEKPQQHPFMPSRYTPSVSIDSVIGRQFASENDRLVATFRQLLKLAVHRQLTLAHIVELDKELRFHPCEEEQLHELLDERHLLKTARRMMYLMADLTGFDEGFMPFPPLNDRNAQNLRKQIDNHLRI